MLRPTNKQLLAELRRYVAMENAAFGDITQGNKPIPVTEEEVTEFIKERTRLYRQSWVEPLIDEIERRLVRNKE